MGNQLAGVSRDGKTVSFTYDDNGMRTSKTVNGTKTEYFNVDDKMTAQRTENTLMIFRYDSEGKPFSVTYNGQEYFYGRNLGGDIVEIVDSSGNTVVSYLYDAWGTMVSLSGSLSTTLGLENPFRFKGMYYDTDAVLYYYGGRYYNPTWGRYLNADSPTALMNAQGDLLATNLYAFEHNDPVNHTEDYSEYGAAWKYMPWVGDNNCMNYAIPGTSKTTITNFNYKLSVYSLFAQLNQDYIGIRILGNSLSEISEDEHRIALRNGVKYVYDNDLKSWIRANSDDSDFHFMSQDMDGRWSNKPRIFRSVRYSNGINPDNILWNLSAKTTAGIEVYRVLYTSPIQN